MQENRGGDEVVELPILYEAPFAEIQPMPKATSAATTMKTPRKVGHITLVINVLLFEEMTEETPEDKATPEASSKTTATIKTMMVVEETNVCMVISPLMVAEVPHGATSLTVPRGSEVALAIVPLAVTKGRDNVPEQEVIPKNKEGDQH